MFKLGAPESASGSLRDTLDVRVARALQRAGLAERFRGYANVVRMGNIRNQYVR